MRGFWVGLLVGVLLAVSSLARADITATYSQSAAKEACLADGAVYGQSNPSCRLNANPAAPGNVGYCHVGGPGGALGVMNGLGYDLYLDNGKAFTTGGAYWWCVPASCEAGKQVSRGQFSGDFVSAGKGDTCSDSCLARFHPDGVASVCVVGGSCSSFGSWVLTGDRCVADLGGGDAGTIPVAPDLKPAKPVCDDGGSSCYDPRLGYCGTSESGEVVCRGAPKDGTPPPAGCANGATGASCVNVADDPKAKPSNPPIPTDTPPDHSADFGVTTGGGGGYTVHQDTYSGTSPGPGSSAGGGDSPGGSNSNQNGHGNSGENGTDAQGHCPDGKVPTASGCSGTYRDDGCDTPPACFGDAVLCGIAANTHKTACNVGKPASGGSAGVPDEGDPMDASGDPQSSAVSDTVDLGAVDDKLDAGGFGYSQSCPLNDWHFSIMGKSVDVPMADKCDLLAWIRYVVLAMAYFVAAKIIAGVK